MFFSILFPTQKQAESPRQPKKPDCFKDLTLDQIFAPILAAKKGFELESFLYTPLHDPEIILYRQEVMRELEKAALFGLLTSFLETVYDLGRNMNTIRKSLDSDDGWNNNYLTRGHLLNDAERYCNVVSALMEELSERTLTSAGFLGFARYLRSYRASESFTSLCGHVKRLRRALSSVEYCMMIKDGTIRVRKYEGQADHSEQILETFEKFRQGDAQNYSRALTEEPRAPHVEAAVLNVVAEFYPDVFSDLNDFCTKFIHFDDETLLRFSREVQFYLSWLDFIRPLRSAGLPFCFPALCQTPEHLYCTDGFGLALAAKLRKRTITNDFRLDAPERIIVVAGPNQGGKTTYARAFGQMHYLAALGLPVAGREAALYLFDRILTHFGREEDLSALNGKLQDDLVRLHNLLENATSKSVIIVNEIYSSTALTDALALGGHMMDDFEAMGAPCVVVTFLDELATHSDETVSMMSTVRKDAPAERTYKVIRKPPDGLAYAMSDNDREIRDSCSDALFCPLQTSDEVSYRQENLRDAMRNPDAVRRLYEFTVETENRKRGSWRWLSPSSFLSSTFSTAVDLLKIYTEMLLALRKVSDSGISGFQSDGF